ncbi:hypothetical protein chiPu_0008736 [Chiloscyllium punctatum]|uniref:Uncharacterized protein n=1 Tax=Chiloscyllium punctatum TaxID=137246 RepID=A0A401SIS0_CHIPU|nr:hypothetical protein [Chiloscyllium punctatum]
MPATQFRSGTLVFRLSRSVLGLLAVLLRSRIPDCWLFCAILLVILLRSGIPCASRPAPVRDSSLPAILIRSRIPVCRRPAPVRGSSLALRCTKTSTRLLMIQYEF